MKLRATTALASIVALCTATLLKDVSEEAFQSLLKENELVFAAFTSQSIESVSSFNTNFEATSASLDTPLVSVDCDIQPKLCSEYDVNSVPTVRLFREGKSKRYRGRRTRNALISHVIKQELPPITRLKSGSINAFKTKGDVVIVAYLRPDQNGLFSVFESVAEKHHHNFVFGFSTDTEITDAEKMAMPSVVAYRNVDGNHKTMNGHFEISDLEKFLGLVSLTAVEEFKEKEIEKWMAPGKLTVYIFVEDEDQQRKMRWELTPLSKKFDQYVKFGVVDAGEYLPMAKNYGLVEERWPALVIHAPMNDQVFLYNQRKKIDSEGVESLLMTILEGKAQPSAIFGEPNIDGEAEGKGLGSEKKGHDEL